MMTAAFALILLQAEELPARPGLLDLLHPPFSDLEAGLEVSFWRPSIGGRIKREGDSLTLGGDLDLGSSGVSGRCRISIPWNPLRLDLQPDVPGGTRYETGLSYWSAGFSGSEAVGSPKKFEESVFSPGDLVRSRFRVTEAGIDVTARHEAAGEDTTEWWLSVGFHGLEADLRMAGASAHETETFVDFNLRWGGGLHWHPAPPVFLGASLAIYTDVFTWVAAGKPLAHVAADGSLQAGAEWGPLRLEAGLRFFAWSFDFRYEQLDLALASPFVGLDLRF